MKRKSKNNQRYETIAALAENQSVTFLFENQAEANTFRRTVLIYLNKNSPDIYTTSVQPYKAPEGAEPYCGYEVVVYNYPKTLDKSTAVVVDLPHEQFDNSENHDHQSSSA